MQTASCLWTAETGWHSSSTLPANPGLILYFGSRRILEGERPPVFDWIDRFPDAIVCGCSTSGEIIGDQMHDDSVCAAIVQFDSTNLRAVVEPVDDGDDSFVVGERIAGILRAPDLRHILLMSDGLFVNGTSLIAGIRRSVGDKISVTGGLAGDGDLFQTTIVGLGRDILPRQVVAIGLYGDKLVVGYGSRGGWESFGPRRMITRAEGNTLYELDGQPALALYKRYLGELADQLPASGLLFPLGVTSDAANQRNIVRTILAVDETNQSLTFAGDIPQGGYAHLMKATSEQLVDGASNAGEDARAMVEAPAMLAILVSCVGRRLVLGQRTEEELEAVRDRLPPGTQMVGFYSYGETCPVTATRISDLHNQTMTVTLLGEIP